MSVPDTWVGFPECFYFPAQKPDAFIKVSFFLWEKRKLLILSGVRALVFTAKYRNLRDKQTYRGANKSQQNKLPILSGLPRFFLLLLSSSPPHFVWFMALKLPPRRLVVLVEPVRLLQEQVHRQAVAVWRGERLRGRPRRERADLWSVPFSQSAAGARGHIRRIPLRVYVFPWAGLGTSGLSWTFLMRQQMRPGAFLMIPVGRIDVFITDAREARLYAMGRVCVVHCRMKLKESKCNKETRMASELWLCNWIVMECQRNINEMARRTKCHNDAETRGKQDEHFRYTCIYLCFSSEECISLPALCLEG